MARVLFPPHPSTKVPHHKLPTYEATGQWVAQRKFNGTHVLVNISPTREVTILNRHGEAPKLFSLSKSHKDQILSLNLEPGKEYWLNGELLDHKTKDVRYKGKIIFFDVLQAGRYLLNSPNQIERLKILDNICRNPTVIEPGQGIALQVTQDIWMAQTFDKDFVARYEDFLKMDEIEGLVLRKKTATIESFGAKPYDVSWILRCRKPHAGGNYAF